MIISLKCVKCVIILECGKYGNSLKSGEYEIEMISLKCGKNVFCLKMWEMYD